MSRPVYLNYNATTPVAPRARSRHHHPMNRWISPPVAFVIAAVAMWWDRVQIAAEEEAMTAIFGDRYASYRRQVRRWL